MHVNRWHPSEHALQTLNDVDYASSWCTAEHLHKEYLATAEIDEYVYIITEAQGLGVCAT